MKFKVVGPTRIAGVATGGLVDLSYMTEAQVAALVEGGHIAPEKEKEPDNAETGIEGRVDNRK